jgi:hypothetical protein
VDEAEVVQVLVAGVAALGAGGVGRGPLHDQGAESVGLAAGVSALAASVLLVEESPWIRVQASPWARRPEAEATAGRVADALPLQPVVVRR